MFRAVVLLHSEYPPSTDIGLHSNIVNLIIDEGKLPTWNPYHMGGEPLTNPPGFYLFASFIVLFTGMPLLSVQVLIAAFFGAFTVFPAYLFSAKIWKNSNAGLLAAFFVAVSSLSLEMLGWGGYPNVVSLMLVAVVFYMFLKNSEQPRLSKLLTTALLTSTLVVTHLLSFFVLLSVWTGYIILLLIGKASKLAEVKILKAAGFFFASIALTALFASPWLFGVADFYLDMSAKGVFLGGMEENRSLILTNRYVDVNILIFVSAVVLMVLMFKASRGKYVDSDSLLLVAWFVVPLILTQAYILGIVTDYLRFMYYVDTPALITFGASMLHIFKFASTGLRKVAPRKLRWNGKVAISVALPIILIFTCLVSPLSITPAEAVTRIDFYTTIEKPEATAINWIKRRTADSAILVSDHLYGWWLSGIAKRSTLSAVSPEFLLYPNEIEVAKSALILLDTDYFIDNGIIQVREDGGYLARHNPIFIINRKQQLPYSVFHFNDSEVTLFIQRGEESQALDLNGIRFSEAQFSTNDGNMAVLSLIRENEFLRVNKTLTVRRGVRFVELGYEVESKDGKTVAEWMRFIVHLRQGKSVINQRLISLWDYNAMVKGQIIFKEASPTCKIYTSEYPSSAEFLFTSTNITKMKAEFFVGILDVKNMQYDKILDTLDDAPENPLSVESDDSLVALSYLEILERYGVTFVVCRDREVYPKFASNPKFRAVYSNSKVTIFEVSK